MELRVGERLNNRYVIEREIGRGGMTVVYLAHDEQTNRTVAIRALTIANPNTSSRFQREASITAKLRHPHIVSIYEINENENFVYFVMQHLQGGNLDEYITEKGQPTIPQTLKILKQIADALDYAHKQGIVHRDVKPSNILLDENGDAYLSDFGVARAADSLNLTSAGTFVGTPLYMSPEQATGNTITPGSDIYALGVMAFYMLTGQHPYGADTPMAMLLQHVNEPVPSISAINPELSASVDAIFKKTLAKEPTQRFKSAGEFVKALSRELEGESLKSSVSKAPPSSPSVVGAGKSAVSPKPVTTPTLGGDELPSYEAAESPAARYGSYRFVLILIGLGVVAIVVYVLLSSVSAGRATLLQDVVLAVLPMFIGVGIGAAFFYFHNRQPIQTVTPSVKTATPETPALNRTMIANLPDIKYDTSKVANNPVMTRTQIITPNHAGEVRLTVIQAENKEYLGMTTPVINFPFVIGRDAEADLTLPDVAISRQHASISVSKGVYYLTDQGSSNGTLLNGMRVTANLPHLLMPGSEIMLSATSKLLFGFERPPEMPEMSGMVIAFRYKLVEKLHQSGKAAVYKAFDQKMNRDVAVKVLSPDLTEAQGYEQQFEQEIKAASSLSHPHVIKIFDFGRDRMKKARAGEVEFNYIVMELLSGGTLETRLKREITQVEALAWLKTLAHALDYVHRQNIIHSGLKPGSIVFDGEGYPYLTDFAIAQEIGKDGERILIGAPLLIAPEQWDNQPLSPKVDQYALAVMAYRLLTGVYPFSNMDSPTQRETHWKNGCRPAHEAAKEHLKRDLAPKVSTVLAKALEREADKRYATVLEFVNALEVALVQTVITEVAVAAVEEAPKPEPVVEAKPLVKKDVFISYRRTTSAMLALHIGTQLEEKYKISAFVDTRSIDGASKFPQRLKAAIEHCEVFICLLADTTLDSEWVLEEIAVACEFNKPMIPIFQESFAQPDSPQGVLATLLEYDGLKVLDKQNMYVEHMVADLAKMVRQSLKK
jgi:serine/threonine protein kinase